MPPEIFIIAEIIGSLGLAVAVVALLRHNES